MARVRSTEQSGVSGETTRGKRRETRSACTEQSGVSGETTRQKTRNTEQSVGIKAMYTTSANIAFSGGECKENSEYFARI